LQSEVYSQSYWAPKLRESHLVRVGVSRKKSHLDVSSMTSHKVYYKGEGGGFLQVQAVVNLVCMCCPWLVLAPRVLQLCTNHFVWVVCWLMWVSEACQLFLIPSRSSNTPLYPSKCCELGGVPWFLPLLLSFTWIHIWIHQGVGSALVMAFRVKNAPFTYEKAVSRTSKEHLNKFTTMFPNDFTIYSYMDNH